MCIRDSYATVLAWPEEKQVVIQSLATGSELYPDKITKIELLGYGTVYFTRTAQMCIRDRHRISSVWGQAIISNDGHN